MNKIMSSTTLALATCLVLGSLPARAENTGALYVGADVGSSEFSGDGPGKGSIFVPGQEFKDSDSSYGLHLGFQFTDWFAAELGYSDFGNATARFRIRPDLVFIVTPNDTQRIDAKGMSLTSVFSHRFSNHFSVLGMLGVSTVDYKSTLSGGFSEVTGSLSEHYSFSDQGLLYGVGARYALNDSIAVRLNLRRHDVGDFRLDTASLGLEYWF